MASLPKIFAAIVEGRSDSNFRFSEICRLLKAMEFEDRISGSHHIFHRKDIHEILNLQPLAGGKAKTYQVKQIRQIIQRYNITMPEKRS